MKLRLTLLFLFLSSFSLFAQTAPKAATEESAIIIAKEIPLKTTTHHLGSLTYTATVGTMPLTDSNGKTTAQLFYTAYKVDSKQKRPLTFAFNGGPGSSSIWLHMGTMGPKRVKLAKDPSFTPPPYEYVENLESWLPFTDLVFIDPIGTGYSRPQTAKDGPNHWGTRNDLRSVSDFIEKYIKTNNSWDQKLFLAGESYGTFRAAGLSEELFKRGIVLSGIVLVSATFDHDLFLGDNIWSYIGSIPTVVATAWYHKKLAPELQKDLSATVAEAKKWAVDEYLPALAKDIYLSDSERQQVASKLSRYTGVPVEDILKNRLRAYNGQFLSRDHSLNAGRFDGRFVVHNGLGDPSDDSIRPAFTVALNKYLREELDCHTGLDYEIIGNVSSNNWYEPKTTGDMLAHVMNINPYLKVFVAAGYYDSATPFFAMECCIAKMDLDPKRRENIKMHYYEAGHMMYIDEACRIQLRDDVRSFYEQALQH